MSNSLEQFRKLLEAQDDPLEQLLARLPAKEAQTLRRCAIPHTFDETTLGVLEPQLSEDERAERMCFLAELSVVVPVAEDLALHDRGRRVLFDKWLRGDTPEFQRAEFARVSRRLSDHFLSIVRSLPETEREVCRGRGIYHLIGADQERGVRWLEAMFRENHSALRTGECVRLIGLGLEYEPLLKPSQRTTVRLMEGMVAAQRRDWDEALAKFAEVADGGSADERVEALRRSAQVAREAGDLGTAEVKLRYAEGLIANGSIARLEIIRTRLERGLLLRDYEQMDESNEALLDAASCAERDALPIERAAALNGLALNAKRLGDHRAELDFCEQALTALGQGSALQRSKLLSNLAAAALEVGDDALAERSYNEGLALALASHDNLTQAVIKGNLARLLWRSGRRAEATELGLSVADDFNAMRAPEKAAKVLVNLARLCRNAGDPAAHEHAGKAASLLRRIGDTDQAAALEEEFRQAGSDGAGCKWLGILLIISIGLLITLAILRALMAEAETL